MNIENQIHNRQHRAKAFIMEARRITWERMMELAERIPGMKHQHKTMVEIVEATYKLNQDIWLILKE